MMPQTLQPYILYENHNSLGHNGSTRLHNYIKRHYNWRKLWQHCNKYIRSCSECHQVTLKEPHYVDLHLPLPQFLMFFITMDLLGPYQETENGDQYALTTICMLTCLHYIYYRASLARCEHLMVDH